MVRRSPWPVPAAISISGMLETGTQSVAGTSRSRRLGPLATAGWWRRHPALVAALIYALLSIVFAGQGLLPGRTLSNADMLWSTTPWTASVPEGVRFGGSNFELADATAVFLPFYEHTKDVLPGTPLWNPHVMGGRPFLANAQSAIFSPFTVPVYLLPTWKALGVIAILKLLVAAFGTFLLGRALGMRFGGALLAGVVYAFGTFFVAWLAWPLTNVFPLLPWLLLLSEQVVRRPGPLPVAGLGALVALAFFGGHPETTFHTIVATVVFFAFRLLLAWRQGGGPVTRLVRPSAAFAGALALGAALAALMLVPLLELFLHSADYARRADTAPGHASVRYLGAFFLPDYWGRPTQTPLIADIVSNRGFYAGGLTLMLASAALILRPSATRIAFAAFAAVTLAVVLGADPFFAAVTALPGFSTAHNGRMVFLVLFCLAMLAGWGLDDITRRELPRPSRRLVALVAAGAIFCVPLVWMLAAGTLAPSKLGPALKVAWGFADPPAAPRGEVPDPDTVGIVRLSALLQWLPLAGAALLVVALGLGAGGARLRRAAPLGLVAILAVAVLSIDLFRANMGFNPAIPIEHAEQPEPTSLGYLRSRAPNRFAVLSRPGIDQPLQPDLAMRYGLYDARGYDYPVERRYDTLWRRNVTTTGDFIEPTQRAGPTERALRSLSLLSVRDILHYPDGEPLRLPGLRLAYDGPDARVYTNELALPRAFLVSRQRTVADDERALDAISAPGFEPRREVVTERRVPGLPEAAGARAEDPGTARLLQYEDERVVVEATADVSSMLVLTDVHFPGWKATVDGRPVDIERVDYLLRGVPVGAGRHRVEFAYQPLSWRVGWIVSLVALLVLAGLAFVGWRRRAPSRGPGR